MTAVEFIKKYGWDNVIKKDVWFHFGCSSERSFMEIYGFRLGDLKKYVDAWELVESYGGLERAKIELSKQSILRWINPKTELLREAIELVESVND